MSTQNPENEKKCLTLRFVFPDRRPESVICDSVRLTVKDSPNGKNGGLYGIRPGHARAVFLLDAGKAEALHEGKKVLSYKTAEGFARVENNEVTVVTGSAEPCK